MPAKRPADILLYYYIIILLYYYILILLYYYIIILLSYYLIENADATPPHLEVALRLASSDAVQGFLQFFALGLLSGFVIEIFEEKSRKSVLNA